MEYRELADTGISLSVYGLGTMTFGCQNDAASAHGQLDRAFEAGVNFIDTAEMYPSPPEATTFGESERIVGRWLDERGVRDQVILATKCVGPGAFLPWIRGGKSKHTRDNLCAALEGSLSRLKTDVVDLYQLHWPDRAANFFGQLGFRPAQQESSFDIEGTLRALESLVASGKVRYIGLSNETPWGLMTFLSIAREHGLPAVVSVQNPYNLLNRSFEVGLAEAAWREGVSLLVYSPLAFGLLTGKYDDEPAADGRLTRFRHFSRYDAPAGRTAARRYVQLARDAGIDPAQMALAWAASKPCVTSVIMGSTSQEQLETNLGAGEMALPRELLKAIDAVHQEISNPCP